MRRNFGQFCAIMFALGIFLVLFAGPVSSNTSSDFLVTNLLNRNFDFTYEQIYAMPKTTVYSDLYCDGSWVTSGNWTGVALSYLLEQTELTPEVYSVLFSASDGYKVAIPIELALQPQIILAYELDSKLLQEGLRLVIPGANGAVWIAKITVITMSSLGAEYPAAASASIPRVAGLEDSLSSTTPFATETTKPFLTPQPSVTPNVDVSIDNATSTGDKITNQVTPAPTSGFSVGQESWNWALYSVAFVTFVGILISLLIYKRKKALIVTK
jgi:hypothetical protein